MTDAAGLGWFHREGIFAQNRTIGLVIVSNLKPFLSCLSCILSKTFILHIYYTKFIVIM